MKRVALSFFAVLGVTVALWLSADASALGATEFRPLRAALMQLTGLVALTMMCVAVLLSLRTARAERALNGLDKAYRLHKWLGVGALGFSVVHWALAKSPGWLVALGWMTAQPRGARPRGPTPSGIEGTLRSLRGIAEGLGEKAFYAAAILIALALIKRFSYRWFQKTHRILAVAMLILLFHAVVLMKTAYWTTALGPVMALLWLAMLIGACVVLARRVGARNKSAASITAIRALPESESVELTLAMDERWKGHEPGQFAFVRFAHDDEPHPFTIASAWGEQRELRFVIKSLGDHTSKLRAALAVGDRVQLEGPYGRFNFESEKPRQLWVAGGIGVTPFLARLDALQRAPSAKPVDFFFCAKAVDDALLREIEARARQSNVSLHVLIEGKDGRLDRDKLAAIVPAWRDADLWFCGPEAFADALLRSLRAEGMRSADQHIELFSMR